MKLKNVLIVVKDIEKSKQFYHDLFGLDIVLDNDGNIILTEGLVLQEEKIWKDFLGKTIIPESNSCELYFEEQNIERFVEKLERLYPDIQYVNRLMTHSWGQIKGEEIMFYGLDQVFNILFAIIFFCVLGTMVYIFVKNISTWNKNNNSPRLTVTAKIVTKRTKVFHNQQSDGFSTTTSTSYYVTFEVKSGDRMELSVAGKEYGQMAEGDVGELSFQGTRFLGFERN